MRGLGEGGRLLTNFASNAASQAVFNRGKIDMTSLVVQTIGQTAGDVARDIIQRDAQQSGPMYGYKSEELLQSEEALRDQAWGGIGDSWRQSSFGATGRTSYLNLFDAGLPFAGDPNGLITSRSAAFSGRMAGGAISGDGELKERVWGQVLQSSKGRPIKSRMARALRIELAGGVYHVTARGDRREDIYFDEADRQVWLELLGVVCERFNWICHGWCQMTNHFHLIVETPEANLALGMRQLNGVYTQAINRKYNRAGHVYQGRYKAILVEKDSYLLKLARYVVLNPVRAGMVSDAGDWAWSSYRAMIGLAAPVARLQTDWLLAQFGDERKKAILGYIDFVRAGVGLPSVWDGLKGQIYLGSDAFISKMAALSDQSIAEIPRAQRRPLAKPLSDYAELPSRKDAIRAAYASGDYTMQEIACFFGVHYSTVSRAVNAAGEDHDGLLECKT